MISGSLVNRRRDYTITMWCRGGDRTLFLIREYCQRVGGLDLRLPIFEIKRTPSNAVLESWHLRLTKKRYPQLLRKGLNYWYRGRDRMFVHPKVLPTDWEFLAFRVSGAKLNGGRLRITSDQEHFEGGTQMVFENRRGWLGSVLFGMGMQGELDEVFVFDRFLSDEEIGVLYERGAVGTAKAPDTIKTDSE